MSFKDKVKYVLVFLFVFITACGEDWVYPAEYQDDAGTGDCSTPVDAGTPDAGFDAGVNP